jgi:predicted ATPase/DNA-binding SARP family transcriptional activator
VRIQLLGTFGVEVDGAPVPAQRWRLRKARMLVAMLALAPGQRMHRDQVIELLWPDVDPGAGAHNLHQAVYVARRAFAAAGSQDLLAVHDEQVALCAGTVEVDALEFEAAATHSIAADDEHLLRSAVESYGGDLLPDWAYEDWLAERRTVLRDSYHAVLMRLAELLTRTGAADEAQPLLDRVLRSDPLHEAAVRAVMAGLAATGRRSEALARYERLRDDLREAFGTDPDKQTADLFRELLTGGFPEVKELRRDNLPVSLTSFVGRARELADVEKLLACSHLITLTGAGGCGKTRLAVEVARSAGDYYADGVWFVDLSTLAESRLVPDVVAAALDLSPGVGDDPTRALTDQLRGTAALIVLDNCEHLLSSCARLVTALLVGCPKIQVFATSREPLRIAGEVTFRVPSLELPDNEAGNGDRAARLARVGSVQLFVERAAAIRPDFALEAANVGAVAELCRRLDGMPLALELAAARVSLLEPAEILARLGDAQSVLGTGPSGAARHETLRAALAWSHQLLTAQEQVLLRRLSVFAGSFTLAAVEAVCGAAPLEPTSLLDLLGRLVDKSLVLAEPSGPSTRYRLLETVRQFSAEQLTGAGEVQPIAAAHCAYYRDIAVAHDPEHAHGMIAENPTLLDREHDNFRAALRWSLAEAPESALALTASLWRFWFLRGHSVEGSGWVERALDAAPQPTLARAQALVGLTGLDARRGRSGRVRAQAAAAVEIAEQVSDEPTAVLYRLVHATLTWCTFSVEEAEGIVREVRVQAVQLGRTDLLAGSTWIRAMCALTREDGSTAARLLTECLSQLESADLHCSPFLPVVTPCVLLVPVAGRVVPSYEESLLVGRRVGVEQGVGYVLSSLGYAARLANDLSTARSVVTKSVERFASLGDELGRAQALNHLGCVLRDNRDFDGAAEHLREARDIRRRLGDRRGESVTKANFALLLALGGDNERARSEARACLAAFEAVEDRPSMALGYGTLANIELAAGELRAAYDFYLRAVAEFTTQSWPRSEAWYRLVAAELAAEIGERAAALREVDRAAVLFERQQCAIANGRVQALRRTLG